MFHATDFTDMARLLQIQARNTNAMKMEEVGTECLMLMVAALDSTAGLICPFINNMVQNPKVYTNLMEEIEAFERSDNLSYPIAT